MWKEDSANVLGLIGFSFSFEDMQTILNASDNFMRLMTDRGTSYIDVNKTAMETCYDMLVTVFSGVRFCSKDSPCYNDKTMLPAPFLTWPPMVSAPNQPAAVASKMPFQTDYEAIDRAAKSCFLLEVYDQTDQLIATGSGFVAFDKSVLITNEHVIQGGAYVIAHSDQYTHQYTLRELTAVNAEADIAVLYFDVNKDVPPLSVDSQARILRGQPVTAIGSPRGLLNTVSNGNISNIVYYSQSIPDYIQFTAPISPGSSGGALFNDQGQVIGLCVSQLTEAESVYFAIPIKYVEALYRSTTDIETITLAQYNNLSSQQSSHTSKQQPQTGEADKIALAKPQITSQGVALTWNALAGAKSYSVYRSTKDASYQLIATVSDPHYSDAEAPYETVLWYYVEAVCRDETLTSNKVTTYRTLKSALSGFPLISAKSTVLGVELKWDSIPGATEYGIFRRDVQSSDQFAFLGYGSNGRYVDKSAKKNRTYEYYIEVRTAKDKAQSNTVSIRFTK